LFNPRDDIAMARVINIPARGIGGVTIEKLQILARQSGRSVLETITDEAIPAELGRAVALKIAPLRDLFTRLQEDARDAKSVADLLANVIERTDYLEFLRREKTVESVDRIANVQELLRAAEDFDKRVREGNLDLIEEIDESTEESTPEFRRTFDSDSPSRLGLFLESSALEGGTDAGAQGEAVTLMTLHAAKGLEFPIVFLVGAEQGLLPHARALWGEGASGDELEEERRLCYVGLTRAEEQVVMTYAAQRTLHGRTETTTPSQFIDEIPDDLIKRSGLAAHGSSFYNAATSWGKSAEFGARGSEADNPKSKIQNPKFAVADRLRHPTFGEGVVVNCSPSGGAGEWVEVAFLSSEVGKKKLVVAFAPLEKV